MIPCIGCILAAILWKKIDTFANFNGVRYWSKYVKVLSLCMIQDIPLHSAHDKNQVIASSYLSMPPYVVIKSSNKSRAGRGHGSSWKEHIYRRSCWRKEHDTCNSSYSFMAADASSMNSDFVRHGRSKLEKRVRPGVALAMAVRNLESQNHNEAALLVPATCVEQAKDMARVTPGFRSSLGSLHRIATVLCICFNWHGERPRSGHLVELAYKWKGYLGHQVA